MGKYLSIDHSSNRVILANITGNGHDVLGVEPPTLPPSADPTQTVRLIDSVSTIIFADAYSSEHFLVRLAGQAGDCDSLLGLTVGALSSETVWLLGHFGVHADLQPDGVGVDNVVNVLEEYGIESSGKVLIVGGSSYLREQLVMSLGRQGFQSAAWPAHDQEWKCDERAGRLKALLLGGAIDGILINRPLDIGALELSFGPLAEFKRLLQFFADDEICRIALAERGISVRAWEK